MRLSYRLANSWPPLAWLARCHHGSEVIEVLHGARVETTPEWFCEAVWDGPYEDGAFDHTDLVFGSGGRVRNGHITFVSAGSTVDRLQSIEARGTTWVSNSLPALLAALGGEVDPAYPHYFRDFSSIRFGLARYSPLLETSLGAARFTYFHNLLWDGRRLREVEKPALARDFETFERYRAFLEGALERLGSNLSTPTRRSVFRLLGTISSGYDSPTIAALARNAGLREAISFDKSRDEDGDSGLEIAERLGLNVTIVPRDAWRTAKLAEIPFIAADAKGEDVFFQSAEPQLSGTVLLTGFHGDKMWGKYTRDLSPDVARGDQSGLSLTEFRLRAGFLHCPVPFMGVRQIADVNRISRSAALAQWDIPGDYTRPICRRIVEEAGVPRTAFGMHKRAASVLFFNGTTFLTPDALAEYLPWLEANADAWRRAGTEPPPPLAGRRAGIARRCVAQAAELIRSVGVPNGIVGRAMRRMTLWGEHEPLFQWIFPWAAERACLAYSQDLPQN
jgi:hypothetical protein